MGTNPVVSLHIIMHIMVFHMPEAIKKNKSLYKFSCQGMYLAS